VIGTALCFGIGWHYEQKLQSLLGLYKQATYRFSDGRTSTSLVNQRELNCLAENIYYEAGGESLAGKMAVGLVTLNRVNSGKFSKTICGVVHQRTENSCQFSWRCEDKGKPRATTQQWADSMRVAVYLMTTPAFDITDGATYFHNHTVKPNWKNLSKTSKIEHHTFYSKKGDKNKIPDFHLED